MPLVVSLFPIAAAMFGSSSSRGPQQEWKPGHIVQETDAEIEEYNRQLDRKAEMQQVISDSVKERKAKCLLSRLRMPEDVRIMSRLTLVPPDMLKAMHMRSKRTSIDDHKILLQGRIWRKKAEVKRRTGERYGTWQARVRDIKEQKDSHLRLALLAAPGTPEPQPPGLRVPGGQAPGTPLLLLSGSEL